MEKAFKQLDRLRKQYEPIKNKSYRIEKIIKNYYEGIELCKNNSKYKLCLYEGLLDCTKLAIVNIKIYVPECSEIVDYTDIIRFKDYIEDGVVKQFSNGCNGVIPNYRYIVGDKSTFEKINSSFLVKSDYGDYYSIDLEIPFIMD